MIIRNSILPPKGFKAINLFGYIFARHGVIIDFRTINHEAIHAAQMREMGYVLFYIVYVLEWLIKLLKYGRDSYWHLSFEREAYYNEICTNYLETRRRYAWINYIL